MKKYIEQYPERERQLYTVYMHFFTEISTQWKERRDKDREALADRSRLLMINALMEKPLYVEILAERLQLSPSTVSFHLKKLEKTGLVYSTRDQYYTIYHLNKEILSVLGTESTGKKRIKRTDSEILNMPGKYGILEGKVLWLSRV